MNIKYQNKHFFLPVVTDDTMKIFSAGGGVNNGIHFNDGPTGMDIFAMYNTKPMAGLFSVTAQCTFPGFKKTMCIELDPVCPCVDCDYEYGITIWKHVKKPGVYNSDVFRQPFFYGGTLDKVSCTSGVFSDAQILIMENDIITQITNDNGLGQDAPGSPVSAGRCYTIEDTDPTTDSSIVITVDGVATTITVPGDHSVQTGSSWATTINNTAAVNANVFALPVADNDNRFTICSNVAGKLFTVAVVTDTSIVKREICLTNKLIDDTFEVEIDSKLGVKTGRNGYVFSSSDWTAAGNDIAFYVGGVLVDVTGPAAPTNAGLIVQAINAAITAAGVTAWAYYNPTTNYIYILLPDNVQSFAYNLSSTSKIKFVQGYSATGKFSSLTSDDIFRIFAYSQHAGMMANEIYKIQPIHGVEYCCYTFKQHHMLTPSLSEGASHFNQYMQEFTVCLPKAMAQTHYWNGKLNKVFDTNYDSGSGSV